MKNNRLLMVKPLQVIAEPQLQRDTVFYPGINNVKSLLIILVVIAHCLPPGMVSYYNYFFEMPLFMAISGFLLKGTAFKNGWARYLVKSTKRLIVPWVIAFLIYLPLQLGDRSLSQISILDFIYPFYHLWFIPAYLLSAFLCYNILKYKLHVYALLLITAIITCVWYILFRDNPELVEEQVVFLMGDKRFYSYIFFFLIGFLFRNNMLNIRPLLVPLLFILVSSFILVFICVEFKKAEYLTVLPYLFFNISLSLLVIHYVSHIKLTGNRLFDYVNNQSLGIYLYHPIIMFAIYNLISAPDKEGINNIEGLAVGLLTLGLSTLLVFMLTKWRYTRKWMLGNIS